MIRSGGWYRWAWDPIEGCKNGCWYCYANKELSRKGKDFTVPQFFEERLIEPSQVKPSIIFVNHWADIMGEWVPTLWIQKVINVSKSLPEHLFIFMTKNPKRYYEFDFPDNCVLSVTIEGPEQYWRAEVMKGIKNRKLASIEPCLGDFTGYDFSQFEAVVIGPLMGTKDRSNFKTVDHYNIFKK
jgi:protein gp37